MITRKLHIEYLSNINFINEKCINFSYGFHLLYKRIEESNDPNFITYFKDRFKMNDIEYRSLLSKVKAFINSNKTNNNKKKDRISFLEDELSNNANLSKKYKYKYFNKIQYLSKSIDNEPVFGGRTLLQEITREHNKVVKDINKINTLTTLFREKRILPLSLMGEANQKGNRFFDFTQISEGKVIYKPFKGEKIDINFKLPKKFINDFILLSKLVENKELALTIEISNKFIYFIFDNEKLNGFSIDEKSRRKEVAKIKNERLNKDLEKVLINNVYVKYYNEQDERKLKGKIKDRCISIDMNPDNIGMSILDKTDNGIKILYAKYYDLSFLCKNLGKRSNDNINKKQRNKRKYELTVILKDIFNIAKHYKCSQFIIEELSTKNDDKILNREANRKINNLWSRNLIESIITKRCDESGIKLIKINPCYTSFIGNIQYNYIDSVNASIEIGRRGLYKKYKGMFYPNIRIEDIDTLESKFDYVVQYSTDTNWVKLYKTLNQQYKGVDFAQRLRSGLNDKHSIFRMDSYKSRIKTIVFNTLY